MPRTVLLLALLSLAVPALAQDAPSHGGKPVGHWLEQLKTGDLDAKRKAVYALWSLGPAAAPAAAELAKAVSERDNYIRGTAAKAIERLSEEDAARVVPGIVPALRSPFDPVRREAATLIFRLCSYRGVAPPVEPLLEALKDADRIVRINAASALSFAKEGGSEAVEPLLVMLHEGDAEERRWAATSLGRLAPKRLVDVLSKRLADEDPEARKEAAFFLPYAGKEASSTVPALVRLFADRSVDVRRQAVTAIWSLGAAAQAYAALLGALDDELFDIRETACNALGTLGEGGGRATPHLVKRLADPNSRVRIAAATALRMIGKPAAASAPSLLKCLSDEDAYVRTGAIWALAAVAPGNGKAVEAVAKIAAKGGQGERMTAISALELQKEGAAGAVPVLLAILGRAADTKLHLATIRALTAIGPKARAAIPALRKLLETPPPECFSAAAALCRIDPARAPVDVLGKALDDPHLRLLVVGWLRVAGKSARSLVPKLISLLDSEELHTLRAVTLALEEMGPHAAAAIPKLTELVEKGDPKVAPLAKLALDAIKGK